MGLEGGLGLGRKEGFAMDPRRGEGARGELGWRGRSLGTVHLSRDWDEGGPGAAEIGPASQILLQSRPLCASGLWGPI